MSGWSAWLPWWLNHLDVRMDGARGGDLTTSGVFDEVGNTSDHLRLNNNNPILKDLASKSVSTLSVEQKIRLCLRKQISCNSGDWRFSTTEADSDRIIFLKFTTTGQWTTSISGAAH